MEKHYEPNQISILKLIPQTNSLYSVKYNLRPYFESCFAQIFIVAAFSNCIVVAAGKSCLIQSDKGSSFMLQINSLPLFTCSDHSPPLKVDLSDVPP